MTERSFPAECRETGLPLVTQGSFNMLVLLQLQEFGLADHESRLLTGMNVTRQPEN